MVRDSRFHCRRYSQTIECNRLITTVMPEVSDSSILLSMNPDYLWLTGALQLLTLFVVGPAIAIAIAHAAWRRKPQNFNPKRYGILCVASGVTASLLLVSAKWIN